MSRWSYLMENEQEARRLVAKTDAALVERQSRWAGLGEGMRVADVGCGAGITTAELYRLVQPGGEAVGIDVSPERLAHARQHYGGDGLTFVQRDISRPMDDLSPIDFIWIRFVLEYHRPEVQRAIVRNLDGMLRPDGILCLIDLDYNCLSHYGMPERLEKAMYGVVEKLQQSGGFDPYAGRRLYSYLYDLGYDDIQVSMEPHHLIYGELNDVDAYNWMRKIEVAARNSGYLFEEYEEGFEGFAAEFEEFFATPRRFTYTPMIACRGRKRS